MQKPETKRPASIPSFDSIKEASEFWDTHDSADYWNLSRPVEDVDICLERRVHLVPVESHLLSRIQEYARHEGLTPETLINIWLTEKTLSKAVA
ncbi:MAG: CopG family antitoxin [bacterium]|nr:CopG family antitoxin [bacterium]